jgi:mycothiol synthase
MTANDVDTVESAIPLSDPDGSVADFHHFLDLFDDPRLELSRDSLGAFDGPHLVTCGWVIGESGPQRTHLIEAPGWVDKRYRRAGIGHEMLRWQLDRAAALHRERHPRLTGRVLVHQAPHNDDQRTLLGRSGFVPARRWYTARRRLDDGPVPAARVPDGLHLVSYQPELAEQTRLVNNAAFVHHWGNQIYDPQRWRHKFTDAPTFRPELCRLAAEGHSGRIVSCLRVRADDSEADDRSCLLGPGATLPEWRGSGVATALLTQTLGTLQEHGYALAEAETDTANTTGVHSILERYGFTMTPGWVTHAYTLSM